MTITREEVRAWLEREVASYERGRDSTEGLGWNSAPYVRGAALALGALAALEDAERWAPKPRERYVRVADELVAQLRAAPSEPVTLEIREEPDGTLMLIATTSEGGPWRDEHPMLTKLYELSRQRDAAERRGDRLEAASIRIAWRETLYRLEATRRSAGQEGDDGR